MRIGEAAHHPRRLSRAEVGLSGLCGDGLGSDRLAACGGAFL
jgi:hypothetical protein